MFELPVLFSEVTLGPLRRAIFLAVSGGRFAHLDALPWTGAFLFCPGGGVLVEVGGIRGVYEEEGDGPPLVLIASPVALAKTYLPTVAKLSRSFRVLTLELPGSGSADRLRGSWGVGEYATWVAGVIAQLGLNRPMVIGHSHSAPIAVALAARHPGAVSRLVVVDATGTGPHPPVRVFAGGLFDLLLELRLVLRAWHHVARNPFLHPTNFFRQVRDSLFLDARADIAKVAVPTLVAWGSRDHTFPPSHAREYARLLPSVRVYLSSTGSHDWLISQPEEFADVVFGFVVGRSQLSTAKDGDSEGRLEPALPIRN